MIVRQQPHPFKIFFAFRGSIIPKIYPQILLVTILSTVITIIQHWVPDSFPYYGTATFTLLGIALSLFLGFRNNASYQRWWEARGLWGQLVYDSRGLTRQLLSFIDEEDETGHTAQKSMVHLTIAFAHAVRHRLRGTEPWQDIERFVNPIHHASMRQAHNLPDYLMRLLGKQLGDIRCQQLTSEHMVQNMDERLTSMTIVLAACERIHNTPLPFAYMLLVHRTTYLYCIMLPFGLVASLGWATPLICAVIAYTFFGLDALSEELEEPFGLAANQLPLTALSRTIEINLLEALGDTDIPSDIAPIKGYLP
ncbi:bestrophin family protein [Psychrobacter aquaticus]|uniref:Putative membrane protein n=1 Tax=Psychrobacter aquaticus CMS 56 TaxID=1354303 RepID=U4T3R5_9GAMM|nr:bestrophin family ion channel [Psychrobacter aquaticus]ERL54751.1 putative membrane protein [Psychrobacter aquaticus CMS 56]